MHNVACKTILEHLIKRDILKGEVEDLFTKGIHRVFMCHYLGHQLGLDVHDVGYNHLGGKLNIRENMVITVEPGI